MSLLSLFQPQARYTRDWCGAVVVLAPGPLPTVDYYLTPRLRALPAGAVRLFDSRLFDAAAEQLPEGTFVIIVRHAAPDWLRLLARHRARWSGVAFLMDDDIPAAWLCGELPLDYRLWTSGRYARVHGLLARVCDRIWVANERLQARYAASHPRLLPPMEPFDVRAPAPRGTRRWAYLGTRTHAREIAWLKPVVAGVQALSGTYDFELFGDATVARQFAQVPRVRVLAPRPWPAFVQHCQSAQIAVGIAPLLPGRFNATRSHVKVFDITRCGAAGVFTQGVPFSPELDDVVVLLPNDPALWIAEIRRLLEDDAARQALQQRASAWAAHAGRAVGLEALIQERVG